MAYYEVGKMLYEAGGEYGESIIENYSKSLVFEVNKKYNYRTLYRMRKFYKIFSSQKLTPMVSKLNWSHYVILLSLKNEDEIIYYIKQCETLNLTKRELQERIKSKEYERLPDVTRNKLIKKEDTSLEDFVKNPIILKNKNNYDFLTEKNLQEIIMENIPSFLKELGEGYSFISNEYKIKIG